MCAQGLNADSTQILFLGVLHPGLDESGACVAADAGKEPLLLQNTPSPPVLSPGAGPASRDTLHGPPPRGCAGPQPGTGQVLPLQEREGPPAGADPVSLLCSVSQLHPEAAHHAQHSDLGSGCPARGWADAEPHRCARWEGSRVGLHCVKTDVI